MMNRKITLLLAGAGVLFLIQFLVNVFYVSPRLSQSLDKLADAQQHFDSARIELHDAHRKLDSLSLSVLKFGNYLTAIQSHTEILFQERELKDAKFKVHRDSILQQVEKLKAKIDTLTLPTLQVYDSRKN
jgi:chromosome segregation ATPase